MKSKSIQSDSNELNAGSVTFSTDPVEDVRYLIKTPHITCAGLNAYIIKILPRTKDLVSRTIALGVFLKM